MLQSFYVPHDLDLYLYAYEFPAQPFQYVFVGEYEWWFDWILAFDQQYPLLVNEWLFGIEWCVGLQAVEII